MAKVDDKGRLKIPVLFKKKLISSFGDEVFVTSLDGQTALIYPLRSWEVLENKVIKLSFTHPLREKFLEIVNFFGQESVIDKQGRILIPPILRRRASLIGDVVVSGRGDHLKVCNMAIFEKKIDSVALTYNELMELSEALSYDG